MGGEARRLGRSPRTWRNVMAAYRPVYGFGHQRADCRGPGSTPEPYARVEYENALTHVGRSLFQRYIKKLVLDSKRPLIVVVAR